jgi:hypothetical protein
MDEALTFSAVNSGLFLAGVLLLSKMPFWVTLLTVVLVFFVSRELFKHFSEKHCSRTRSIGGRLSAAFNQGSQYLSSWFDKGIAAHKSEPSFTD